MFSQPLWVGCWSKFEKYIYIGLQSCLHQRPSVFSTNAQSIHILWAKGRYDRLISIYSTKRQKQATATTTSFIFTRRAAIKDEITVNLWTHLRRFFTKVQVSEGGRLFWRWQRMVLKIPNSGSFKTLCVNTMLMTEVILRLFPSRMEIMPIKGKTQWAKNLFTLNKNITATLMLSGLKIVKKK